jgi:hypothetical protein
MTKATMTSPVGRIYAAALTLFTFFLTWALVAAKPWPSSASSAPDPRLRALAVREQKLRRESIATQKLLKQRWAAYRSQLARRNSQIAAAARQPAPAPAAPPSVRIVSQPAATATSTS